MVDRNSRRKTVIQALFILVAMLYVVRLMALQLFNDSYKSEADRNAVKRRKVYATRGLIYDRQGKLIVYNDAIYDLYVIPSQVQPMDTGRFCRLLEIDESTFVKHLHKARRHSKYKASVFLKQIPAELFTRFQEHLRTFPGFYGQVRPIRHYPYPVAPHSLGDVGEVDSSDILRSKKYYQPGDYIGKSGMEKTYETQLRGKVGVKYVFVDALNREMGAFREGRTDTVPRAGRDLHTTLDIDLQLYGELLMQNKTGSIVALEPATGEILALVSSPGFDPNMLCGRKRGQNFKALTQDTLKPLFNRAIMAQYPPGSTFKPLIALIALNDKAIPPTFSHRCNGFYTIPGYVLHCSHGHPSAGNIVEGLQHSCNPYFWQTFRNTLDVKTYPDFESSYDHWVEQVESFGLGSILSVDIPGEKGGNIPDSDYYNRLYGKRAWKSSTILSLGIGQGEILMTPLQLANLFATIGNRGHYYTPHVLKGYRVEGENFIPFEAERRTTTIDAWAYDHVVEGLYAVVERGTARRSRIAHIPLCGKTGTAQNPHGEDHSLFAAFAPKDRPAIAIAVVVENSGGGSRYAAPIASLMIEKYLTDSIADNRGWLEQSILEADFINR